MRPLGRRLVGFGFGLCFGFAQNRSRSRRGGKVGIPRLLRDFQGSVEAGGNLLLVFAGFHAPAFSTALLGVALTSFSLGGRDVPRGGKVAGREAGVQTETTVVFRARGQSFSVRYEEPFLAPSALCVAITSSGTVRLSAGIWSRSEER